MPLSYCAVCVLLLWLLDYTVVDAIMIVRVVYICDISV